MTVPLIAILNHRLQAATSEQPLKNLEQITQDALVNDSTSSDSAKDIMAEFGNKLFLDKFNSSIVREEINLMEANIENNKEWLGS